MQDLTLTINGEKVTARVEPRTLLADFLREHAGAKSVHLGCEHGVCGACTILLNGETARSCIALAVDCDDATIQTLEGLEGEPVTEALRECFHTQHGLQCGFCTPGMLVTGHDYISRGMSADAAEIRQAFSANICRCTGYAGIVRAVGAAARVVRIEPTTSSGEL